jgi:DMSO reductase anchor subunit
MHPAPSLIGFTVLSGLGFGLIFWLGLGFPPVNGRVAATFCALALALTSAGLLSSLLHLGRPRRFLKAFSQWRSSWLSREAILVMATLATFGLYGALWTSGARVAPLGLVASALAFATAFSTAMIYAQMRTVPRWRTPLTPAIFLLSALAGGALLAAQAGAAAWFLVALAAAQIADWRLGDRRFAASGTTLATATGLGRFGAPRLLEPPHTGGNYLLREMVHVVGRVHAAKLRVIGLGLATLVPVGLVTLLPVGHAVGGVAVLAHVAGMMVLRWLFFAQAEHVVGLYYGRG